MQPHAGVSNYPENATPAKIILTQRVLIPCSDREKRWLDCAGREEILLCETSPDGLEVRSAWQGPDGPPTCLAPSWKTMALGTYQPPLEASDAGSRNSQEHQHTCNYADLTGKLQHPTQTNTTLLLQETNTRGLETRTVRPRNAAVVRFHILIRWPQLLPK